MNAKATRKKKYATENFKTPTTFSLVAERNARLIALLDSFEEGDSEQQQRDLNEFQVGIDDARPAQRSIFGDGFNK